MESSGGGVGSFSNFFRPPSSSPKSRPGLEDGLSVSGADLLASPKPLTLPRAFKGAALVAFQVSVKRAGI